MTTTDPTARYTALRSSGLTVSAAVTAMMKEGFSLDAASDASWKHETGKGAPHADDHRARRNWERGNLRRHGIYDE